MRFKNRYIIVRIHSLNLNSTISPLTLDRLLRKNATEMFGSIGNANLVVKYYNNDIFIVRCGREDVIQIRAVLTFTTKIEQTSPVCFEVLSVNGSLRTCRNAVTSIQAEWHMTVDETIKQRDLKLIAEIQH